MKNLFIFTLCIFLLNMNAYAATSIIEKHLIIEAAGKDSINTSVNAKLYINDFKENNLYKDGWRWGTEETPRKIVTKIQLTLGNENIFVPLSAYMDLANPRTAVLNKTNSGFKLEITGGDAAYSYHAVLYFENKMILKRRVKHGEFSKEAWEETIYSFVKGNY